MRERLPQTPFINNAPSVTATAVVGQNKLSVSVAALGWAWIAKNEADMARASATRSMMRSILADRWFSLADLTAVRGVEVLFGWTRKPDKC